MALKARVTFQDTFAKNVQRRLFVDFSSGDKSSLFKNHRAELERVQLKIAKEAGGQVENIVRSNLTEGLKDVSNVLKTGIPGAVVGEGKFKTARARGDLKTPSGKLSFNWERREFNPSYFRHKAARYPQFKSKFWRRSGELSHAFEAFVQAYLSQLGEIPKVTSLGLQGGGFKQVKGEQVFRYKIDYSVPVMRSRGVR